MLSSTTEVNHNSNKKKTLNRVSSSSSSSSSSFSHHQTRPKTMEEVWKDINLSSLNDHPPSDNPRLGTHQNPNCIFQDFLNRPFSKDRPTSLSRVLTNGDNRTASALYGSTVPPPATVLSLNSGSGFEFLETSDNLLLRPNSQLHSQHMSSNISSFNGPLEALVSSSHPLESFGKKRAHDSDNSSSDRKNKRMIKNRESAARSRARKQAYTNELELEVAHLMEENARLKRQQEQLRAAAAASQLRKNNTLQRTSTAPF